MTTENIVAYPQIEATLTGPEVAVLYLCAITDGGAKHPLSAEGGPIWLALESAGESGLAPNLAELRRRAKVPITLDFGTASALAETLAESAKLDPDDQAIAKNLSQQLIDLLPSLHATTQRA